MNRQQQAAYGRVRQVKRDEIEFPMRDQYNLREACRRLGLRIMGCQVEFYNPHATGRQKNHDGTYQWIDVMAVDREVGLVAIDLEEKDYRFAKRFEDEKRRGLAERGIPYLVCTSRGLHGIEVQISVWLKKLKRGLI